MSDTPEVHGQDLGSQVLNMRRAGVRFDQIAQRLGLPDAAVRELFDRVIATTDREHDVALEVDRLDRLHVALWPKALAGDLQAVDRVLRISERREKLVAPVPEPIKASLPPEPNGGRLAQLRSLHIVPNDAGGVQAG